MKIYRLIILVALTSLFFSCKQKTEKIQIMAAASLTELINDLAKEFEEKNKGIKLNLNFAGSQALASQIEQGARVDVFLSANKKYMEKLDKTGFISYNKIFAYNELSLVINSENKDIKDIEDVLKKGIKIAIADKAVPVGSYTEKFLEKINKDKKNFKGKFEKNVVSKDLSVKNVALRVQMNEADCGIVYKTDINRFNKNKVRSLKISDKYNIKGTYLIGKIKSSKSDYSDKFIEFIFSEKGKELLEKYNFVLE